MIGAVDSDDVLEAFGHDWAVELRANDGRLHAYRRDGEAWTEISALLPPVFDDPLPETARRVAFAFDQSGRLVVGYEDQGVIRVTRWDTDTGGYVQNVTFAGHDPALLLDGLITRRFGGSDVVLFYLDTETRSRIKYRIQREHYHDEHDLHDLGAPGMLDRAQALVSGYQLLVADAAGDALGYALQSGPYPVTTADALTGSAAVVAAAYEHFRDIYEASAGVDGLTGAAAITEAIYTSNRLIVDRAESEDLIGAAAITAAAYQLTRLILDRTETDNLTGAAAITEAVYSHWRDISALTVASGLTGNGAITSAEYREV